MTFFLCPTTPQYPPPPSHLKAWIFYPPCSLPTPPAAPQPAVRSDTATSTHSPLPLSLPPIRPGSSAQPAVPRPHPPPLGPRCAQTQLLQRHRGSAETPAAAGVNSGTVWAVLHTCWSGRYGGAVRCGSSETGWQRESSRRGVRRWHTAMERAALEFISSGGTGQVRASERAMCR